MIEHTNPLFAAFLAGFNLTGEQWNGETHGPVQDDPRGGTVLNTLRSEYEMWRLAQEKDPG